MLQTSELEIALRETQTRFYALDLHAAKNFSQDDGFNLLKLHVKEAEKDGALNYIASTYDPYDQVIRTASTRAEERSSPLPTSCNTMSSPCPAVANRPEVRTTGNAPPRGNRVCRQPEPGKRQDGDILPLADTPHRRQQGDAGRRPYRHPDQDLLLRSNNSLGHGIMDDLYDVVYVKTEGYSASNNPEIARDIERMNQRFLEQGRNYILIGPGRWGSSDPWLASP